MTVPMLWAKVRLYRAVFKITTELMFDILIWRCFNSAILGGALAPLCSLCVRRLKPKGIPLNFGYKADFVPLISSHSLFS